jgi:hypothetical protein
VGNCLVGRFKESSEKAILIHPVSETASIAGSLPARDSALSCIVLPTSSCANRPDLVDLGNKIPCNEVTADV